MKSHLIPKKTAAEMQNVQFKTRLGDYAARTNSALERWLPEIDSSPVAKLSEACRYSILSGGKRIRAALALMVGECYKNSSEAVLRYACAIELIHAYSLIHDDLPAMDNDDFRRGKPTNHKVFGEAMAILAGDNLLTTAFEWLSDLGEMGVPDNQVVRLVSLVSRSAGQEGMIGGQVLDIASENQKISLAQLENIHRLKTGALICAPVCGAAIICNASMADLKILNSFAEKIGLLFQIVDDLLDVEGSLQELGKTPGKDAKSGKATYPGLLGLEKARELARQTHADAISSLEGLGTDQTLLAQMADFIYSRKN